MQGNPLHRRDVQTMKAEQVLPPTPLARRFVRYALGFFVGVAIGMAPILGSVDVPGFKALLNVMPFQIASELIPLSAYLMGIIAVAVQYFAGERTPPSVLRKLFRLSLFVITVGFLLFVILRDQFTVGVRRGGGRVTVLISSSPVAPTPEEPTPCGDCKNPKSSPASCIRRIGLEEEAIEKCWGYEGLTRRSQLLKLSYLILTGGVGVLIGFLLLRDEARRQEEEARRQAEKEEAEKKAAEEEARRQAEAEAKKAQRQAKKSEKAGSTASKKAPATKVAPEGPEQPGDAEPPKAVSSKGRKKT
jgi:hypothetical protein